MIKKTKFKLFFPFLNTKFNFFRFSEHFPKIQEKDLKRIQFEEAIKLANSHIDSLGIQDSISSVVACLKFGYKNDEFFEKVETKLIKKLHGMDQDQIVPLFKAFSLMEMGSVSFYFMMNKVLTRKLKEFSLKNFIVLIKSLAKVKKLSKSLLFQINEYVKENFEKFENSQIAEILIVLPKLNNLDIELIKKLWNKLKKEDLNELKVKKVSMLFFVVNTILKEGDYNDRFFNIFEQSQEELNNSSLFQIILCCNFSRISLPETLQKIVEEKLMNDESFFPEELNSIIQILNNPKNKPLFEKIDVSKINEAFYKFIEKDEEKMNLQELSLYLYTLLSLDYNINEKLFEKLQERIITFNKEINFVDLICLLDIIRDFNGDKRIKKLNLDFLANIFLKKLQIYSFKENETHYIKFFLNTLKEMNYSDQNYWNTLVSYLEMIQINGRNVDNELVSLIKELNQRRLI